MSLADAGQLFDKSSVEMDPSKDDSVELSIIFLGVPRIQHKLTTWSQERKRHEL